MYVSFLVSWNSVLFVSFLLGFFVDLSGIFLTVWSLSPPAWQAGLPR